MKRHKAIFICLGVGAILVTTQSHALEPDRGRMLYENNCLQCHESQVHIREKRKVQSLKDLEEQIIRWSKEIKLAWRGEEIRDVSRFLNQAFYKFDDD